MIFQKGELVFLMIPVLDAPLNVEKHWAMILGKPFENWLGGLEYYVFCSDGRKRVVSALHVRKPREVTPIYQGEREGNPEGGKPDPDVP